MSAGFFDMTNNLFLFCVCRCVKYFMQKGMMYTNKNGKRVDPAYLHIREWLEGIRTGTPTSCDIGQAYEEAISAHMAVEAYKTGRKVYWDEANKKFVF